MKKLFSVFTAVLLFFSCAVADDSDDPASAPEVNGPAVKSITISPESANLERGGALQFYASVQVAEDAPDTVTWSLSGNKAKGTVLSANGHLSVDPEETAEKLTVTAVSTFDAKKTKTAAIAVWPLGEAPESLLTVTSLEIHPRHSAGAINVTQGGTVSLYATINTSDIVTQKVEWSFYHYPNTSTYPLPEHPDTVISSSGLLTVSPDEPLKTFQVRATYTPDKTVYATRSVKVWENDDEIEMLISPRAPQETFVGAPYWGQVKVRANVRHFGGTVTESLPDIVYSGNGAPYVNRSTGVFEPAGPGTYTVTASYGGKSVTSGPITVHPADYLRQPYYYPGTGVTYQGKQGPISYKGPLIGWDLTEHPLVSENEITIIEPKVTTFDADRFFTLEAVRPEIYNYVLVTVSYLEKFAFDPMYDAGDYCYGFRDASVSERIWLCYGPGLYSVEIEANMPTPGGGVGQVEQIFSARLYVNNIRDEPSLSDARDRRYLLPVSKVQSDKLLIGNIAREETLGITDTTEKVKAFHDYLAENTEYDKTKPIDALSVLSTRYPYTDTHSVWNNMWTHPEGRFLAECEGYSFANAALLRVSGIETKTPGNDNHQWNSVYINGSWKLVDVTWDDVHPLSYQYFMLSSRTGVNNDHPLPSGMTDFLEGIY